MIENKVLIAGGGIGGTSAALSLAKLGFDVEVFEQSPSFAEIGAGIQLSPNCTRVLFDIGLEEALRSVAFVPEGVEMRHWSSGRLLNSSALGDSAVQAYGYPYFHVHRADLMQVLVNAANDEERIVLHENALVTDVSQDEEGVALQIDGEAGGEIHRGDILVGADGIRSVVRSSLFGPQAPKFTGNVAWRALVKADQLPPELVRPMATAWWGPHKHFVHYYVRSGELVNCVCVVEKKGWEVESWTERGEYSELKQDFAGWHEQIQTLIDQADRDSLYKWALYDRPPMSKWGDGRITLLGDACHPTLPFMAQGAAMAIEDGAVLARCLSLPGENTAAKLQHYEDLRRDRTAGVQLGSRRNAKVFHLSGVAAWLRNRAVKRAAGNSMTRLYQYDALEVAKPPRSLPPV